LFSISGKEFLWNHRFAGGDMPAAVAAAPVTDNFAFDFPGVIDK
jgi:hypothetical protein